MTSPMGRAEKAQSVARRVLLAIVLTVVMLMLGPV